MKGAVGNAFILNMVITFILIFYTLLIGSMAYSKAYRTKNYLINMIDEFARNGKGCCAPIIMGERNGAICVSKYSSSIVPSSFDSLLKLISLIPTVSSSPISCS